MINFLEIYFQVTSNESRINYFIAQIYSKFNTLHWEEENVLNLLFILLKIPPETMCKKLSLLTNILEDILLQFPEIEYLFNSMFKLKGVVTKRKAYASRDSPLDMRKLSLHQFTKSDQQKWEYVFQKYSEKYLISYHLILGKLNEELNLSLHKRTVNDDIFSYIINLTQLTSLNLKECINITDHGISFITSLTNLQHLNISYCKNLTTGALNYVSGLSNLISLNISKCNQIFDSGLIGLSVLSHLQVLNVIGC